MTDRRSWGRLRWTALLLLSLPLLPVLMPGEALGWSQQNTQTGSVRGRVRQQKGGDLADVQVIANGNGNRYETKSDARGNFELREMAPGEYSFSFAKAGFKTFSTRRLTVTAGEPVRLRQPIELAREEDPYAVIRGAVLHGVGFTLPNARVTLERIDGRKKLKMETVSREGGEFAFRFRADKALYRITATAQGFQSASLEIPIDSDEVRNIALTLTRNQPPE